MTSPDLIRTELADWVGSHWDPGLALRDWRGLLLDSGWAVPSWPPRWHGRGLPAWADELVASELTRLGAVGLPVGSGTWLAAPTILAHGSDELRERLLAPILTGEQTWCQLFSEPGAGSDLAGLSTTAVLDGDSWVINGQKVWNTSAHHADMGMLLARTDCGRAEAQRHQLLRAADAAARGGGQAAAPDELPRVVQRGLPDRRPGAARQRHRRGRARAGR